VYTVLFLSDVGISSRVKFIKNAQLKKKVCKRFIISKTDVLLRMTVFDKCL